MLLVFNVYGTNSILLSVYTSCTLVTSNVETQSNAAEIEGGDARQSCRRERVRLGLVTVNDDYTPLHKYLFLDDNTSRFYYR